MDTWASLWCDVLGSCHGHTSGVLCGLEWVSGISIGVILLSDKTVLRLKLKKDCEVM